MTLKRIAACFAAAILVAASFGFGASAAWAAVPAPPGVDQLVTPWVTSNTQPQMIQGSMSGTGAPYIERIEVFSSSDGGATYQPYCSEDIATPGPGLTIWICDTYTGTLALGTNLLAATAINADGTSPQGVPITITVVDAPTITSPIDGEYSNNPLPSFSGTAVGTDATVFIPGSGPGSGPQCTSTVDPTGTWSCTATLPLADGVYNYLVQSSPSSPSGTSSALNTITIDTTAPPLSTITSPTGTIVGPTIVATTTEDRPTITGTGEPGAVVTVFQDYSPISCQTLPLVAMDGIWSCVPEDPLALGTYIFSSLQTDRAGNVSFSGSPDPQLQLTITAPAVVPPPATVPPPVPATPVPALPAAPRWTLSFQADSNEIIPGQTVTLSSSGLPPGAAVIVELHSTPTRLGTTVVDAGGSFTLTVVIPHTVEAGEHHYVVTVTPEGEAAITAQQPVTVVIPPVAVTAPLPESEPETATTGDDRMRGAPGVPNRNDPATPNALSGAIPSLGEILTHSVALPVAGALALAIMLLAAIPSEILSATLSSSTGRFGIFFRRMEESTDRATEWLTSLFRTPAVPATILILGASIIFGFVDPAFGFDLASLRIVLALGIGLFILTYAASRLSGWIIRRAWNVESGISMQPIGLVFAALGVIASRILEFSPGFLVGLVIGLELARSTPATHRIRSTVVQFGVIFGLSLLSWLGYSFVIGLGGEPGFGSLLLEETLVAVTAEGLTALLVAMLPIGFLEGKEVFDRSKTLWAGMFLVVGTAFALLVLPTAMAGDEVADLGVWTLVLLGFAVVTLALWAVLYYTGREPVDAAGERESVDANR